MSAAIAQKNTTTSIYFECGDIFSANKSNEKEHKAVTRMNVSIMQDLSSLSNTDNISTESLESQDKMEQQQRESHYNFHNALTRTISQPQPQPQRESNVASLVTTLIENLGNMNLHRKLERTQSEPLPQQVNTSRYKTELCRPFEEAGECKYGEKCQFAHGYHELRNLQRHPKYKTEYCRTFHSVGFCPYGPRCHFVHNADEARAMQQMQQQQQQQHQHTKLQNHSSFNGVPSYAMGNKQPVGLNHSLPLSPPLSLSTGSDRESPTGSLSLSPTTSMTSFPFGEQISPANSVFQTAFSYVNTPPESPNAPISPVNTPPPSNAVMGQQIFIKPISSVPGGGKQLLQKSSSSPIAIVGRSVSKPAVAPTKVSSATSLNAGLDADMRLPVFNRLSSAVDAFVPPSHVAL